MERTRRGPSFDEIATAKAERLRTGIVELASGEVVTIQERERRQARDRAVEKILEERHGRATRDAAAAREQVAEDHEPDEVRRLFLSGAAALGAFLWGVGSGVFVTWLVLR